MTASDVFFEFLETPLGDVLLEATEEGLTKAEFVKSREGTANPNTHTSQAKHQLSEYFAGTRQTFTLSLAAKGTPFQQQVWQGLLAIPYGETCSYAQLANKLNNPKAVRAVGAANGKNPIAIIVPCHRVIGANGTLTGYAGGLERKAQLLALESPQQSL